jgi:hypothetical protein
MPPPSANGTLKILRDAPAGESADVEYVAELLDYVAEPGTVSCAAPNSQADIGCLAD